MIKKLFTYTLVLILIISILFVPPSRAESMKKEDAVMSAFNKSGAQLEETNINSHVVFKGKYMPIDNLKKICNDIAERLNFKKVEADEILQKSLSQIIIRGQIEEGIYATLIVQSSQYEEFKESTIVLDIIDTKGEYDLGELCDRIRNVLSLYGQSTVNITLTGSYNERLTEKNIQENIENILKTIGAKEVEGINSEELTSVTGYTPRVEEHLSYFGEKANINIAYRYNSFEGKTNVWIGTPIIVLEY